MNVFVLNWRDIRSPRAGGAERVTHEVARRLVARGHSVAWLSSEAPGLPKDETVDGVFIHRRGSELTTRLHARRLVRDIAPDVVLEEINTLPYLSPLWSEAPVLLYMNQLARDVWWYEAPRPIAAIGWLAEPFYLQVYRGCDIVTISTSSRDDLRNLQLGRRIDVTPLAVDVDRVASPAQRDLSGALVAVGRLTPSKRYDHAIRALAHLRSRMPSATLTLVGDGRDRPRLEELAAAVAVSHAVTFTGRVSEEEKIAALDRADLLVGTSVREGWGLTVTEAAARGTPSVVYDIPGFRDAVIPGRTGLLVEPNPEALADAAFDLLSDAERFREMQLRAWSDARVHDHEPTADVFERALKDTISSRRRG